MSFTIRKRHIFRRQRQFLTPIQCNAGVFIFFISLIMYLTYISSSFVLGEKKKKSKPKTCLSGIGSINVDFSAVMVLGKTDIFPLRVLMGCFFSYLLPPRFKPAAVSGQADEFRSVIVLILIFIILTFIQNE